MSATDSQNPNSGTQHQLTAAGVAASRPVRRRAVAAWALWDWGASAYSTIVTSFVFAPYLTGVVAKDRPPDSLSGETWLGIALFIAGFFVAALAPVTGQRADAGGHRKRSLAIWSALVIASTIGLFFVSDDYRYLWLGLAPLAAGSAFMEFAGVAYNAMLQQISNPTNIGKISGLGWGSGYLGGIVVMLLSFILFIQPEVGLFGVTAEGGLKYRALALGRRLVRVLGDPHFRCHSGDSTFSRHPTGGLLRLLPGARARRRRAVPLRSARGLVPPGQRPVPRRIGGHLQLWRGSGGSGVRAERR